MDPLSLLVTAWVLTVFLNRLPDVLREVEFAKRGETSPAYEARLKRLADAGIDPATGGAARQYLGNAWRDAWLDLEEQRQQRRAERLAATAGAPASSTRLERLRSRVDNAVSTGADRWRQRTADSAKRPAAADVRWAGGGGGATPNATPPADTWEEPGGADPIHDDPPPRIADPLVEDWSPPPRRPEPEPEPRTPAADPPPTRVESTAGTPVRNDPPPAAQLALEGNPTMTAITHVTGVVSGAAEARAIQRQVEAATAAFEAAMRAVRNRINNLGNATLGEVQQATYSRVVAALQQAAEAAAGAEADAKRCSSETGPALAIAARHFDRLNS